MRKVKDFTAVSIVTLLLILQLFLFTAITSAYASGVTLKYDSSNVLDDLRSDAGFNINDYPYNESNAAQVISFIEYCYSFKENMRDNYAIYIIVYNPAAVDFDVTSSLNRIQIATEYDSGGNATSYDKYPLEFCNKALEPNYYGLFYKFRVSLTEDDKAVLFVRLNSNSRRYDVSGIELLSKGSHNATDYQMTESGAGITYYYSGYAAGYGPDSTAVSTLVHETSSFETISLDVKHTYYRPEGSISSNDRNTQNQLNSVYFSVPNSYMENYGDMHAVKAEWWEYRTKPIFVTGNQTIYDNLNPYVGVDIGTSYNATVKYGMAIGYIVDHNGSEYCKYSYNVSDYGSLGANSAYPNTKINKLDYLIPAKNGNTYISAGDFSLTGEKLQEYITEKSVGKSNLINGKYAASMFESGLPEDRMAVPYVGNDVHHKLVEISRNEEYQLTSTTIGSSFWDRLWGNYNTTEYTGIKAIQPVTTKPAAGDSNSLYVDKNDMDNIISAYDTAKSKDSTLFLFRFGATEYTSIQGYNIENKKNLFGFTVSNELDRNVYMARDTAFLDFDIISLSFEKDEELTVIPVVSNPIDVFSDITPPINWVDDDGLPWWVILIIVVVVVILLLILLPIIPSVIIGIFKALWWIISLPFKLIWKLLKTIFGRRQEDG